MTVLITIDRPGLAAALAARGIASVTLADVRDAPRLAAGFALCVADRWLAGPARLLVIADDATALDALDAGAEDALNAATGDALVAARIARLLGRATLAIGDLAIDTVARRAVRRGRALPLLPREFALLCRLARAGGRTVTREALRADVWGLDFDPGTNRIEVHVSRLRAKLHAGAPPMLLTDKGAGYRLVAASAIEAGRAAV